MAVGAAVGAPSRFPGAPRAPTVAGPVPAHGRVVTVQGRGKAAPGAAVGLGKASAALGLNLRPSPTFLPTVRIGGVALAGPSAAQRAAPPGVPSRQRSHGDERHRASGAP